ncbi:putative 3,4-dihydroxy-2-butanone kinase isoform X1 [Mangifera indica]|uniref:putative 3,4-dihydroxy-2-butanone kinase isoform X1 n=1 Tax=Mangifera indica TaxID=29780 RepID=UPI001CF9E284|nr:putative 3,4-dihydroxy-2-butanone kinase isoform X1 [Mangifera indica]
MIVFFYIASQLVAIYCSRWLKNMSFMHVLDGVELHPPISDVSCDGLAARTAIVGDDSALPPPQGIAGQRGLAGPILVYKLESQVAGASCCCWPFPFLSYSVTAEANRASEMVGKMGVALSVCTLPGQVSSCCLGSGKMELGLEINLSVFILSWLLLMLCTLKWSSILVDLLQGHCLHIVNLVLLLWTFNL